MVHQQVDDVDDPVAVVSPIWLGRDQGISRDAAHESALEGIGEVAEVRTIHESFHGPVPSASKADLLLAPQRLGLRDRVGALGCGRAA
jgi:hypothetical protein